MEHQKGFTGGPVSAVQCPWCGGRNNLSDLREQMLLEEGARIDCDHCKRLSTVVKIDTAPRVILKQFHGR